MRFKHHLDEDIDKLYNLIDKIKLDCKPILKIYRTTDERLCRGMKNVKPFGKIKVRKDRRPKDMDIKGHNYLDKLFKKHHGWRSRSEGVFCMSDSKYVRVYGSSYIIFPIENYKYLWNKEVKDLYGYTSEEAMHYLKDQDFYVNYSILWDEREYEQFESDMYEQGVSKIEEIDEALNDVENKLDQLVADYKSTNIREYLRICPSHEIMIKCDEYYYVSNIYNEVLNEKLFRRMRL